MAEAEGQYKRSELSPWASKLSIGGLRNANVPGVGREAERQGIIEGDVPNVADICLIAALDFPVIQVGLHLAARRELHFPNGRGVAVAALDVEYADVGIEKPRLP